MVTRHLAFLAITLFGLWAAAAMALPGAGIGATVTVWSDDAEERFLGSALVLGDGETVVTNAHVVGQAARVILKDHEGERRQARVVARDGLRDLALLRPERPFDQAFALGENAVAPGEIVYALGSPLGTGLSVTAGIVSATGRQIDPQQPVLYLQHSAPVNPGSSGGPLLNRDGRLVGMNSRIADGSRFFVGIAYAIPASDIAAFVADPHGAAQVNPGLQVRPITRRIALALELADRRGVLVEHVVPGGPADRAGVAAGDILLRLGGATVSTPGDIALILARRESLDSLTVLRDGQEIRLSLDMTAPDAPIRGMEKAGVESRESYSLAEMGVALDPDGAVTRAAEGSVGFSAGLSAGDRIRALNGAALEELAPGWQDEIRFGRPVLLLVVLSDGSTRHVVLDPWARTPRLRPASGANVMDPDVVSFE